MAIITLYRPSNYNNPRAPSFSGRSIDSKPINVENGAVELQDGFVLTVNVTLTDATIKVSDADGAEAEPITGTNNQFLLDGLGDTYTVEVSKDGYMTNITTITNSGDQTIVVKLYLPPT